MTGRMRPPPPTGLLDPRFVYVPAASTDIRLTFERIRAEMAAQQQLKQQQENL